ncbi:Heh2p [Saccharomyces cerevisiae YJM1419]|nr:Heh2p [Saccharomyces cerevisiae YJM1419]CAI6441392.1 CNT_HP1_G0011470.mRNA.1.CDS.1 [Saccharomyces cerevisiae]
MDHRNLDPKTLKVSQLRRVLVENDVAFPANARKPVLVKLFDEKVRQRLQSSPEASKVRTSIQKVVKSGAKNADRKKTLKSKKLESSSSESKTVKDENVETNKRKREQISTDNEAKMQIQEEKSPKKKRKKRSSKANKPPESPPQSKSDGKATSADLTSELESVEERHKKDSSDDKPRVKELPKPELPNLKVSNEFLAQLNKELASAATENYDHSVKSTDLSSIRIETEEPIGPSTGAETRNESEVMENINLEVQPEVKEAKEELTKISETFDNQDEEDTSRLSSKKIIRSPKGRTRHFIANKTKRGIDIMKPFIAHLFIWLWNGAIFLSIICPILFGLWYREQRIQVGYCGHEKPLKSLAISAFPQTERVDSVLQAYRPNCLECPEHGICSSFMNVECEPGYEPKSSILETYGIIPFPKYCAKDESKEKEVDELVWKVNEYLKKKNAQHECGEGENLFESGERETKLYDIFSHSRPSWESQREFNDHWKNVLEILKKKDDIIWLPLDFETNGKREKSKSNNTNYIYRSTSKKWVTLQCHLEGDIQEYITKYGGSLFITLGVLFLIKKIQSTLDNYVQGEQIIEKLVKEAIDKLKDVKKNKGEEPFLTTVQLRATLLSDIPNIKEQNNLWAQTKEKIMKEQSENIELYLLEENGEIMTCWEWKE